MPLPRRKQGGPIESVQLKVELQADRKTLLRIKKAVPEAAWKSGELEVRLESSEPARMVEETKALADRVRAALEGNPSPERNAKTSKRL